MVSSLFINSHVFLQFVEGRQWSNNQQNKIKTYIDPEEG
jgi:hypothetical protein